MFYHYDMIIFCSSWLIKVFKEGIMLSALLKNTVAFKNKLAFLNFLIKYFCCGLKIFSQSSKFRVLWLPMLADKHKWWCRVCTGLWSNLEWHPRALHSQTHWLVSAVINYERQTGWCSQMKQNMFSCAAQPSNDASKQKDNCPLRLGKSF